MGFRLTPTSMTLNCMYEIYAVRSNYVGISRDFSTLGGNRGVSEQCFTSPPTQYRLYGRRFLQVKRPNQQYQSTEGDATKYKENNRG